MTYVIAKSIGYCVSHRHNGGSDAKTVRVWLGQWLSDNDGGALTTEIDVDYLSLIQQRRSLVRARDRAEVYGVMKTTSVSQLELRGMAAGDDARAENPTPVNANREASAAEVETRGAREDGNRSRADAPIKSKATRNAREAGGVKTLLNFAEAARVLGISLRQFRRLVDGGRVAFVKVSERTPRIRPSELQRFLEASAVKYSEVQS